MIRTVRSLVELAKRTTPEAFAEDLGALVLVGRLTETLPASDGWGDHTAPGDVGFKLGPLGGLVESSVIHRGTGLTAAIGRADDNEVVLHHASVSHHHARVAWSADGTLWVRDEGSSNGTRCDGRRLVKGERAQLTAGRSLEIGDLTFTVYESARLHGIVRNFRTPA